MAITAQIIYNYRFAYKQKHGTEWQGSNEELSKIYDEITPLSTSEEEDAAIMEQMEALDKEKR